MSQENPKVSVIIPVYNTEKYLHECLDSVVNQTLKDIEIICVDDGSTDSSPEILREYAAKDDRVKVYTQEKSNAGVARNVGLSKATGEYLAFLDSDDFYELFMLEHMLSCAQESTVDVVVCRFKAYYDNTGEIKDIAWSVKKGLLPEKKVFCYRDIERDCFQCILGYNWDKLIKRALVVENGLRFQSQAVYNDALFTYTALISAKKVTFLDEALVFHRHRSAQNSIGDTRANYIDCSYTFLSGLKLFLLDIEKYDLYERDFINYVIHMFSVDLMSKGRDSTSKKAVKEKITLWLDEFHANEHALSYYYNLPEYEELLQQVFTRKSVHELEERKKPLLAAKSQTVIPIVYATDFGYMRYTLVSMVSALLNARRNTFYAFTVLVPQNSGIDQSDIDERLSRFDNYSLSFIEMGNEFADLHMHISHITSPTFYRLRIASLLENYNKCIYLDGDTVVFEDLQSLYNIDLQDNYLGGVPAYGYYKKEAEHRKRLELNDNQAFQYINAGVLLMNLKKLREDEKEDQFLKLLEKDYSSQDQDILNMACYGKIQFIPYRYNMMTPHTRWKIESFPSEAIPYDIILGRMYPAVIHYAAKVKPWNDYTSPYSNLWFSVAMTDVCWDHFSDISILREHFVCIEKPVSMKTHKSIPEKLRGGVRCYRDHGAGYTFRRTLYHMGLWEDEENPDYKNRPLIKRFSDCYSEHSVPYTAWRVLVKLHLAKDGKEPALIQRMETKTPVQKKPAKAAGQVKKDYAYYSTLPPEKYPEELKLWYKRVMKEDLDLDNPKTYNEKIQWMKLYDATPLKTRLADKYLVRDWVKKKIGEEYLIPLLGVWDSFDEIDFDKLPDQFVLKANHGSGWNIIVKDKSTFDIEEARKKFDVWMHTNFAFKWGLELHYMNIPPKIIAEKYMENLDQLIDYKVWCSDGKARFIWVDTDRYTEHKRTVFSLNWERMPVRILDRLPIDERNIPKPRNLEKMIRFAELMSKDFALVRVDFYEVGDKLYFGEMTFTSGSGTEKTDPREFEYEMGNMITLPPKSPIPMRLIYQDKRTEN